MLKHKLSNILFAAKKPSFLKKRQGFLKKFFKKLVNT